MSLFTQYITIIMLSECNICRNDYNLVDKYAVQICSNKHACCNQCFDQIYKPKQDGPYGPYGPCPFCRQTANSFRICSMKCEALDKFRLAKAKFITERLYQQMRILGPKPTRKQINAYIWRRYKEIEQQHDVRTAINFLERLIELEPEMEDDTFIGLGSFYEHVGFSEKCGYDWYENRYNLAELSLYDQLSVALQINEALIDDFSWVQRLIVNNPSNYKAIFEKTIVLQCGEIAQLDFKTCFNTIKINPDFDKPYEILAFMHLYNNNTRLAMQFAIQCLKRNSNNIFAEYILAVSDKYLTSFQVLQRLQGIIQKEPMYVRALHSYGKELSKICRYEKAIQYYEKCIQINPHFLCPLIDKAIALIDNSQREAGINLLHQLLNEQRYSKLWGLSQLGAARQSIGDAKKAKEFYEKVCSSLFQKERMFFASFYQEMNNWAMAIKYYSCDPKNLKNPDTISAIAKCHQQLRDYQREMQWLHKLHSLKNSDPSVQQRLARSYQNQNCLDGAIYWYRKCMQKVESKQLAHMNIIQLLYKNDQCTQSLHQAERHRKMFSLSAIQQEDLLRQEMNNYLRLKELKEARKLARM